MTTVKPIPDDMHTRYGQITDPFGHQWSIATHFRDVSPEEMQAEMMKPCPA